MKKVVLLTAWLCFALNFAFGQENLAKITGAITDNTKKPVDGITVSLLSAKDSTVVKTILTNTDGMFAFASLASGQYILRVIGIGYKNYTGAAINVATNQTVNLPAIDIEPINKQLKQVEVSTQKAFVEQKIDRTVVNVGASISNVGANALEALEKAPGIIIDDNGTISYKGKSGVMVLIDDKPSYLSGEDLANYLKSLPASTLDQIELMSNPPAKYDASGNAGVINIKTKKSKVSGFNGSVSASTQRSKYGRHSGSTTLNYHTGKVNIFANASYTVNNSFRRLDVGRTYLDANGNVTSSYTEMALFYPSSYTPNIRLGMDYYASPKTTWGIVITSNNSLSDNTNPVNSMLRNSTGALDSNIVSNNYTHTASYNQGVNLNYSHQFDSAGRSLTFDLDYIRYNNGRSQSFFNNSYNAAGALGGVQDITDDLPAVINIYAAKTDYTHPINKLIKLAAGLKTSFVNTDNAADYFNILNNTASVDYNRSNRFLYKENINAGYINYNGDFKQLSIQAGLRAENTNVNGHQLGNIQHPDSTFTQHYVSLFPTAYLLYKLDTAGKHTLNFSYGRRIDRPYYADLNPFVTILDKYSAFTGNPFLKPQYASNYELTYSYKSIFSLQLEYHYISQYIVEYDYQAGNIFYASNANLGGRPQFGINASLNLSPAKWWSFNFYTELVHNKYTGALGAVNINVENTYYYFNDNNQFNFGKGWSGELSTFYLSPSKDAQFTHRFREQTNIGIRKKILNNKATLSLSARDIFRANFSAGMITNVPGAVISYHNDNANRSVALGFTYNFGSNKDNPKHRATGSADSEAGRVGN